MKRTLVICLLLFCLFPVGAVTLGLDSCRHLALQNNHKLQQSQAKIDAAKYTHKAAVCNYFPKVKATAGYLHNQKELSLLSDDQKNDLENVGNHFNDALQQGFSDYVSRHPELLASSAFNTLFTQFASTNFGAPLNSLGESLVTDMRTDTRDLFGGVVTVEQPIYMGGKIVAYDKITNYAHQLAQSQQTTERQEVLLETDQVYWQVVSLANKQKLAESYRSLLQTLGENVDKLVAEGVATQADRLTIQVKINEADMQLSQVENGLSLSRMLLCQICGLDLEEEVTLIDERLTDLTLPEQIDDTVSVRAAIKNRPEIRSLLLATEIYKQKVNIVRSDFLPTVALVGNYMVTNPNLYDGFQNKFSGMWNVGVMVQVPICHWGEGAYKVKAAKAEAQAIHSEYSDAQEKISLQVKQCYFRINEVTKKLYMAKQNQAKADENLRYATLGFEEGVIASSNVLEAHTAWLSAHSQQIDAQIEVKMAQSNLQKALGLLDL